MNIPKIIAFDLDGTLLTTDKRLSERNRAALQMAAERGTVIVPVTGRIFRGLPQVVRDLPGLKYAITCNGASVYDIHSDRILYRKEMDVPLVVAIMSWLDGQPLVYDCYMDDWGWISAEMYDRIEPYAPDPNLVPYIKSIRTPVKDLKSFLRQRGQSVQKIMAFCRDEATQRRLLSNVPFPGISVSSSATRNVEINHADANKGAALMALAEYLHIEREAVMAFGDGLNDLTMLRAAGTGVAMGNAGEAVKAQADRIAADNDDDGVAGVIEEFFA